MVKYETIKENFENGGCKLITSEAEMILNKLGTISKYTIIAKCGHQIDNCWYHMFMYRNTGKKCKNCIDADSSVNNKKLNKTIGGNCYSFFIEAQSINIIKKYLNLEIKVSPECCIADIAIKDHVIENKWLPVQIKATLKGRCDIYSFGLHKNYENMIILFVCIEEEKFWILNGNLILNQCKLSIGIKKSKYNKYQVDKNDLSIKLLEFYNNMDTLPIETIQTPITENCKKEQLFRKLRETKLNLVQFEYPEVNQCVYDFKINNYKIQEKTAFIKNLRNYYMVILGKNKNGDHNNSYDKGDNDFYWINLQDNETFYIIPEQILITKNIISSETEKGKRCMSFAKRNIWLENYKYSYNEENINEIINNLLKVKVT